VELRIQRRGQLGRAARVTLLTETDLVEDHGPMLRPEMKTTQVRIG
jgi:hypothetical protein